MSMTQWAASGIRALYHLEDEEDDSGNDLHLTNTNGVTFVPGRFGKCAELGADNVNRRLTRESVGVNLGGSAGISFWAYIETEPASGEYQTLCWWTSTTVASRMVFLQYMNESGTKKLFLGAGGTETKYTVVLPMNVWIKFDIVIGSTCYVYLNGALLFSGSRGTGATTYNYINIGYAYSGSPLKGRLDEVVLYNVSRTAGDIRRRYAFEIGKLI